MIELYKKNSFDCSKITTLNYSTSFSMGIKLFKKKYRLPIYGIYGFVRFADEIVDTFHDYDKKKLLKKFADDTWDAIETGLSTNPILHSFQSVVNEYKIPHELIKDFLTSMEMDLTKQNYEHHEQKKYIYGSAEVVGLMCLKIFYKDNEEEYNRLLVPARKLGEAFQKVNFLRDIKDDYKNKNRIYFPKIDLKNFADKEKIIISEEIEKDFNEAYQGILSLKKDVRYGVLIAYKYYLKLLKKIQKTPAKNLLNKRIRISDVKKVFLFLQIFIRRMINI